MGSRVGDGNADYGEVVSLESYVGTGKIKRIKWQMTGIYVLDLSNNRIGSTLIKWKELLFLKIYYMCWKFSDL